jgi:hypothetical protein
MRNNAEIQRNLKAEAIIKATKLSRPHTALASLAMHVSASIAIALVILSRIVDQRRTPTTAPTTVPTTVPTTTPATRQEMENFPHAALARKQTTLRIDVSTRKSMSKLKLH